MIRNPFLLTLTLVFIESAVIHISGRRRFKKFFKFIPPVFWIYFLPMLAATFKFIDRQNPLYQFLSANLLPAALILLLLSSDVRSILRLEKPALIMMLAGSLGIMIGIPLAFFFMKPWVGGQMWPGFGALSASWTGGSANMIAVKEALNTPDAVFMPMVVVDTIVPYVWMGILIAAAAHQKRFDAWNRSDCRVLDELSRKTKAVSQEADPKFEFTPTLILTGIALSGVLLSRGLAARLPVFKNVISDYTWAILLASFLGIALSFTPARKLEKHGASRLGYFVLYLVLTSIGARAGISSLNTAFLLIIAGFLAVFFHAFVLLLTARIIKAPLFLVAAASQANIGGAASAPVVAEIYQRGLASAGLLLAILGNILGTYCGIITGQVCRWVAGG
ncbi:MAG: DUF819 family protein [Candidatus Omnitrophota bacterium]|jgi:uncharacterized membrane protein